MYKILQPPNKYKFQQDLLDWYNSHKRDLPWRKNQDPYSIWVSEVMLQQTKVETVIPYFEHFMHQFPSVYDLAAADEQNVLKAWEGLGYYSRARNLQHAVREVVASYDGKVPEDPEALGDLKGIGPYTKGAILSIAYDYPEPAVDGNVMRVMSRLLKYEENIASPQAKKTIESIVRELIPHDEAASFNQAIMELGALVCTPKAPMCMLCPVNMHCEAFEAGVQEKLPIKSKAKKQKILPYAAVLIRNKENAYVIEQRPPQGLLANMWQFPMVPLEEIGRDHMEHWLLGEYDLDIKIINKKGRLKHVFSHIIWEMEIYEATTDQIRADDDRIEFVDSEALSDYPFPVPHQKMMSYIHKADKS